MGPRPRSRSFSDLVGAAERGESWAVDSLAREYLPRLVGFSRARGATDPDGIADVALTSVLHRLPELRFEYREQLWAYLCLTARSRIIDEQRRAKPVELTGDTESIDDRSLELDPFDEQIIRQLYLSELLDPLTDEQRRVLELRFLADLSIEETANLTGRTQGAVKGLQRRAIKAILVAVAVLVLAVAVRGVLGRGSGSRIEVDTDPIGRVDTTEDAPDIGGEERPSIGVVEEGQSSPTTSPETIDQPPADGGEATDRTGSDQTGPDQTRPDQTGSGQAEPGGIDAEVGTGDAGIVRLSSGTEEASRLNIGGPVGEARLHGARVRCNASHLSSTEPLRSGGQPDTGAAQIHWGNTETGLIAAGPALAGIGRGTCDGGVTDRSAYWMPAMFDATDQVVLPETILVEYKSFGGPGFDRQMIQPIPAGLQLLAEPTIANGPDVVGSVGGVGDGIRVDVIFPSCVRVDANGRPVLSSPDHLSHLSFPSGADGRADGCPASHPFRIPTITYRLTYAVPWQSDWHLASGEVTAGAISGWSPANMADLVTCVRDLLEACWFAALDQPAPAPDPELIPHRDTFGPQPVP